MIILQGLKRFYLKKINYFLKLTVFSAIVSYFLYLKNISKYALGKISRYVSTFYKSTNFILEIYKMSSSLVININFNKKFTISFYFKRSYHLQKYFKHHLHFNFSREEKLSSFQTFWNRRKARTSRASWSSTRRWERSRKRKSTRKTKT